MKIRKKNKIKKNGGAAMIMVVFFFVFISLTILIGIINPVIGEYRISSNNFDSKQSYFNAESGAEDILYRIKNNMSIGIIGTGRTLFLNGSFVPIATSLTDLGGGRKQIVTTGSIDSNERKVSLTLTTVQGVSFNYGVLVGQGGVTLGGGGIINGNIYANGPITGDSSAIITGTAISANSSASSAGQIINGSITGNSSSQWNQLHIGTVSGTAQAHTVNYVNSTGDIYCKSGTGNNKNCIDKDDPTYIAYPVSEANMAEWQAEAISGGTYTGDYSVNWAGATLGPKKIDGDLKVSGGGTLIVSGTIWVTGNIILNGGSLIKLASSYGTNDGVIIADGTISVTGGGHADGSGTSGSYLMLLSLSDGANAMSISGGAGAVIAYAPYGTITISGGASLKEATGYKMVVLGGSSITYESGLTNNNFSSGPSGSWGIEGWRETE